MVINLKIMILGFNGFSFLFFFFKIIIKKKLLKLITEMFACTFSETGVNEVRTWLIVFLLNSSCLLLS